MPARRMRGQGSLKRKSELMERAILLVKKNSFFESGKYLVIPLGDCLHGNVAIVARIPLKGLTKEQVCARPVYTDKHKACSEVIGAKSLGQGKQNAYKL